MNNLTNIIEGIIFASGEPVPVKFIVEKLGVTLKDVNKCVDELKVKFGEESGIQLLTFNGKLQFASNPKYKDDISRVLVPVKVKELTKTILECAAIIAYKQPITKPELEDIRQVNCDYAVSSLLDLKMIVACGRKDAVGKPIMYATTDEFLKRFKLNSIDELPDYDDLMQQIAELNNTILTEDDDGSNYLYKKDEYVEEDAPKEEKKPVIEEVKKQPKVDENGYELPDFIDDDDEDDGGIIKIN